MEQDKLIGSIGYLLRHVASVANRQSDQALQERLGIGLSQFRILMLIQWQPGIKQRDIAANLGQTEASISRQVGLLQERGMLTTRINSTEKRVHLTTPTAKGIKLTEAAREVLTESHRPLLAALKPKQRQQLLETLTSLHQQACAPGRPMACDHANDIQHIYEQQSIKA